MKKILTAIAALAMVAGLASCQKENVIDNGGSNKTTITARFADTKVSYSESDNKLTPYWESSDKVLGLTSGGETFTLEVTSISGNVATLQGSDVPEGSVKLIYVSGISSAKYDSDNKKYVISYNGQKGDKTMPAIMTASGTIYHGCGEFTFDNNGAVIVISNVGAALKGKTIKQVTLYGKDIASSAAVSYTEVTPKYANGGYNVVSTTDIGVTVSEDGSLSENILMAVSAGAQVEKIFIRLSDDNVYSLESTNKSAIGAGTYRYVRGGSFTEEVSLKDAILTGVFSVKDKDLNEKQVFFSKGNLYYDSNSSSFKFEDLQEGYCGMWLTTHVSHFFWSQSEAVAYAGTYNGAGASTTDVFFTNGTAETAKTDFTVNGVTGKYRTLSKEEWNYLSDSRTVNGGTGEGKSYSIDVTLGEIRGIVLYPDNYTGSVLSGKVSVLPEGVVFLPAAGYRDGTTVYDGEGDYWLSSPNESDKAEYVYIEFGKAPKLTQPPLDRKFGCSVRLVTECK